MLYTMFRNNEQELIHKWTHYFPIYERFLHDFVNKSVVMIEIGVFQGGSLKMWRNYLGPFATIIGIDINEKCILFEDDQCKVFIGDQKDTKFLSNIIKKHGRPDIILDDGSHIMEDMTISFNFLYPLLNNNGVYIVEDTHTCYWEQYGGGLKSKNSFIEKSKDKIDQLHAYHTDTLPVNNFTNETFSISFFDSVVVFEKRKHLRPYHLEIGTPSY